MELACSPLQAACCYFSAKNTDILQPAQKVFISWNPTDKIETFTVQPKFEGNALDFGMVIPTPSQPKLSEMPRDFFKHLAVYTIMKRREYPNSRLLDILEPVKEAKKNGGGGRDPSSPPAKETATTIPSPSTSARMGSPVISKARSGLRRRSHPSATS